MKTKKVIILMMENQSYDHLLGWSMGDLGKKEYSNSLDAKLYNSIGVDIHKTLGADEKTVVGKIQSPETSSFLDPPHSFDAMTLQLFGISDHEEVEKKRMKATGEHYLRSFVERHESMITYVQKCYQGGRKILEEYMSAYTPDQVPWITFLAKNFLCCTQWYCSVPGPTGPNRLFAHCASSGGYAGDVFITKPTPYPRVKKKWIDRFKPNMRSIFNSLQDKNRSWRVYWDGSFSTTYELEQLKKYRDDKFYFREFNDFISDVKKGDLTDYTFLNPCLVQTGSYKPNTQHSGAPVFGQGNMIKAGDDLIGEVYTAIAESSLWEESLLLVTYDENGGYFDSASPPWLDPRVIDKYSNEKDWIGEYPPDTPSPPFLFNRLGPRVPAIIVSPYVKAGVSNVQYEHSSIPATLRKIFDLGEPLSNREKYAATFDQELTLNEPQKPPSINQ